MSERANDGIGVAPITPEEKRLEAEAKGVERMARRIVELEERLAAAQSQRDDLAAAARTALDYIAKCVEPSCDEGDELEDGTIHDGSTAEGNALRAALARLDAGPSADAGAAPDAPGAIGREIPRPGPGKRP